MFELQARRERGDRFPWEADINQIEGAELIPLGELPDRLDEFDPAASYVEHCKMGGRGANAVDQIVGRPYLRCLRASSPALIGRATMLRRLLFQVRELAG